MSKGKDRRFMALFIVLIHQYVAGTGGATLDNFDNDSNKKETIVINFTTSKIKENLNNEWNLKSISFEHLETICEYGFLIVEESNKKLNFMFESINHSSGGDNDYYKYKYQKYKSKYLLLKNLIDNE